jgi:hypothetical protein
MFKLDKFFLAMAGGYAVSSAAEAALKARSDMRESQRQQLLKAKASTEAILKQALEMKAECERELAERDANRSQE